MIERSTTLAFRQPQEAKRAMRLIAARIKRARAVEALDGLSRSTKGLQGGGSVEMRGGVRGLGCDRRIKASDCRVRLTASRGYHAQVMRDGCLAGRHC